MGNISPELAAGYTRLQDILRELGSVAVAFSAGVDSTLVLRVAIDVLGADHVVAVTGRSDSLAARELQAATELAKQLGVDHVILDTDEFSSEDYLSNPINRCYHCKTTLYARMTDYVDSAGAAVIVNGINADDHGDFRPGIRAAAEYGVRAPVAEAGLTKDDIRRLSVHLGLHTADKPASPCLSSRVPYGERITPEKLRRIELAEAFLHDEAGIRSCRVRHHGALARIEVDPAMLPLVVAEPLRARMIERFRELGFKYVTVDLRGFRSGSLNEVVQLGTPRSDSDA